MGHVAHMGEMKKCVQNFDLKTWCELDASDSE